MVLSPTSGIDGSTVCWPCSAPIVWTLILGLYNVTTCMSADALALAEIGVGQIAIQAIAFNWRTTVGVPLYWSASLCICSN
jgi:hypothetical protein